MQFGDDLQQMAFIAMVALRRRRPAARAVSFRYIAGGRQPKKRVKALPTTARRPAEAGLARQALAGRPEGQPPQAASGIAQPDRRARKAAQEEADAPRPAAAGRPRDLAARCSICSRLCSALVIGFGVLVARRALVCRDRGLRRRPLSACRAGLLNFLRKRRQQVFLNDFADAIDVMVRGLKSGLPVTDAMKVIASETPAPVGPEFLEVVEGQRIGITIDQGIERMYERMPLAEVNFLSIVMTIQSKTGGNLVGSAEQSLQGSARPQEDEGQDQGDEPGGQGFGGHHRLAALLHHGRADRAQSRTISIRCWDTTHGQHHGGRLGRVDADRRAHHAQDDQFRFLDGQAA